MVMNVTGWFHTFQTNHELLDPYVAKFCQSRFRTLFSLTRECLATLGILHNPWVLGHICEGHPLVWILD